MDVFLRYAALTDYLPNKSPTRAYDARIFYVVSGQGEMLFENEKIPFSAGSLFMYPAGTLYLPVPNAFDPPKFVTLNFDYNRKNEDKNRVLPPVLATEFDESKAINSHLECDFEFFSQVVCLKGMDLLELDFLKIVELFLEGTVLSLETANALLSYLCLKIAGSTKAKENSLCHKVCNFIRANYKEPLTVAKIAKEFNYHPNYLGVTFGKIMGSSVLGFLNDVRLGASKELLLKGNSVTDTAFIVGFKNADHFSKKFTEKFGLSPTSFKKENLWI